MTSLPSPTPKPQPRDSPGGAAEQANRAAPRPVEGEQETPDNSVANDAAESGPSSMASGFVAMLAKGQVGRAVSEGGGAASGRSKYELKMAREVATDGASRATVVRPEATPAAGSSRGWMGGAWFVLAGVLLLMGVWGAGALMYMARVTPATAEEVEYPLVKWGAQGGYTKGSRQGAWVMVAGLPLGLVAAGMGLVLRQRKTA